MRSTEALPRRQIGTHTPSPATHRGKKQHAAPSPRHQKDEEDVERGGVANNKGRRGGEGR